MSLTMQQPKGQCVWGARAIILVAGKHFAEKWARRIVLPNCWDFFAELGGWLHYDYVQKKGARIFFSCQAQPLRTVPRGH